jgi:3-oxoacyl-[acyl-carrier protein] reductase
MQIENVRAIVTGAASGLGKTFALELAKAGGWVAAGDIDTAGLEKLAAEASEYPGRLVTAKVDVSQEPSVVKFVSDISRQFGEVNVLVNNAGILRDGLLANDADGWIKKLPSVQWQQAIDVNLTGGYLMAREVVADVMKRKLKQSVIINISSISSAGNPGQSNYAASKAGLDACTRTWALELASHGVRVAGIAPGVIETPILNHITDEAKSVLHAGIPLGRFGVPHEVWLALKFILECDYFTGRIVQVDGGSNF